MRYGTGTSIDAGSPFDTDNHAWQRFTTVAADHFDVVTWTRPDDRPVMVSLVDLHTGDTFTVAVLDSLEVRDPHVLLALSTTGELTVHGPADGVAAVTDYGTHLAVTGTALQATGTVPLHAPASADLPETAWIDLPPNPVTAAAYDGDGARAVALVLIDRERDRLAVIGPFPNRDTAERWRPTSGTVEQHVVALQPIPPATPTLP
ncbi:hypothetical protein Dvina_51520 [Dactylosporangium vinaceum]|uniref:Uncharacterized protein n=1 Tax=Dactylosporangium vinaceum TaxID=53362 RepID=A0ABV5M2G2_9ACTN|nr:hypothetical protein [Dactylosporangium vinaceum]UAB96277.1 hypothetical protein Dvina_51520 [Dactylosporangium vinaceum]